MYWWLPLTDLICVRLLAISNFPTRRQKIVDKVKSIADAVGQEIEEAMQKDLSATIKNMDDFVALIGKPYEEAAQQKLDNLLGTQEQLVDIEKKLQALQIELQNLHLSWDQLFLMRTWSPTAFGYESEKRSRYSFMYS